MTKKWFGLVAAILAIIIIRPALTTLAQATSTPTYTPTWSNTQRVQYATIPYASNCDPFNPCGALPWPVPRFPTISLPSPTLINIYAAPATNTGTPTLATATPIIELTSVGGLIDTGPISTFSQDIGSIGGTLSVQSTAVLDVGGTPVGINEIAAGAGASVGGVFAFIRAVQSAVNSMGILGTLLNFAFYSMLFAIFIYLLTALLPILLNVIRFVLQVISTVFPILSGVIDIVLQFISAIKP